MPAIWVAVGQGSGSTIATSTDGASWSARANFFDGGKVNAVAWNGSLLVAGGTPSTGSNFIGTSPDGLTWTARSSPFSSPAHVDGIGWSPDLSQWVAVGGHVYDVPGNHSSPVLATSPDGVTWTSRTIPISGEGYLYCAHWSRALGRWFVGGSTPTAVQLLTSTDGVTWTAVSLSITGYTRIYGMAGSTARIVAVGDSAGTTPCILTSTNGTTWTTTGSPGTLWSVVYDGVRFLAAGTMNKVGGAVNPHSFWLSLDGLTWSGQNNPFDQTPPSLTTLAVDTGIPPTIPANDNWANATTISGATGSVTGSNRYATAEVNEPDNGYSQSVDSVWWKWTAPSSGSITFDTISSLQTSPGTTGAPYLDTVLDVWTGTALTSLALVGYDDDGGGNLNSRFTFTATSGTTYYIRVSGYWSGGATTSPNHNEGTVHLNWH